MVGNERTDLEADGGKILVMNFHVPTHRIGCRSVLVQSFDLGLHISDTRGFRSHSIGASDGGANFVRESRAIADAGEQATDNDKTTISRLYHVIGDMIVATVVAAWNYRLNERRTTGAIRPNRRRR